MGLAKNGFDWMTDCRVARVQNRKVIVSHFTLSYCRSAMLLAYSLHTQLYNRPISIPCVLELAHMIPDFSATHLETLFNGLKERQLLQSALLFLAAHRPLAFVAGQGLHLLAPLSELAGMRGVSQWGEVLCDPTMVATLEQKLRD